MLNKARAFGAEAHLLSQVLFANEGRVGQRKLSGVLSLADRYPRRLVNAACGQNIEALHSYRHVEPLTGKLVAEPLASVDHSPQHPGSSYDLLAQHRRLVRSATAYGASFARCAAQPPIPLRTTTHAGHPGNRTHPASRASLGHRCYFSTRVMQAQTTKTPFREILSTMLQHELD